MEKKQRLVSTIKRLWFKGTLGSDDASHLIEKKREILDISKEDAQGLVGSISEKLQQALEFGKCLKIQSENSTEFQELQEFCEDLELTQDDLFAIYELLSPSDFDRTPDKESTIPSTQNSLAPLSELHKEKDTFEVTNKIILEIPRVRQNDRFYPVFFHNVGISIGSFVNSFSNFEKVSDFNRENIANIFFNSIEKSCQIAHEALIKRGILDRSLKDVISLLPTSEINSFCVFCEEAAFQIKELDSCNIESNRVQRNSGGYVACGSVGFMLGFAAISSIGSAASAISDSFAESRFRAKLNKQFFEIVQPKLEILARKLLEGFNKIYDTVVFGLDGARTFDEICQDTTKALNTLENIEKLGINQKDIAITETTKIIECLPWLENAWIKLFDLLEDFEQKSRLLEIALSNKDYVNVSSFKIRKVFLLQENRRTEEALEVLKSIDSDLSFRFDSDKISINEEVWKSFIEKSQAEGNVVFKIWKNLLLLEDKLLKFEQSNCREVPNIKIELEELSKISRNLAYFKESKEILFWCDSLISLFDESEPFKEFINAVHQLWYNLKFQKFAIEEKYSNKTIYKLFEKSNIHLDKINTLIADPWIASIAKSINGKEFPAALEQVIFFHLFRALYLMKEKKHNEGLKELRKLDEIEKEIDTDNPFIDKKDLVQKISFLQPFIFCLKLDCLNYEDQDQFKKEIEKFISNGSTFQTIESIYPQFTSKTEFQKVEASFVKSINSVENLLENLKKSAKMNNILENTFFSDGIPESFFCSIPEDIREKVRNKIIVLGRLRSNFNDGFLITSEDFFFWNEYKATEISNQNLDHLVFHGEKIIYRKQELFGYIDKNILTFLTDLKSFCKKQAYYRDKYGSILEFEQIILTNHELNRIKEVVKEAFEGISTKAIYWGRDIPDHKVRFVLGDYIPKKDQVKFEEVALIYDNTVSGVADEGLTITPSKLYWKNGFTQKGEIEWSNIKNLSYDEGFLTDEIVVNSGKISLNIGSKEELKALFRVLKTIKIERQHGLEKDKTGDSDEQDFLSIAKNILESPEIKSVVESIKNELDEIPKQDKTGDKTNTLGHTFNQEGKCLNCGANEKLAKKLRIKCKRNDKL